MATIPYTQIDGLYHQWLDADYQYRFAVLSRRGALAALRQVVAALPKSKTATYNRFRGNPIAAITRNRRSPSKLARVPWRRVVISAVSRAIDCTPRIESALENSNIILGQIASAMQSPVYAVLIKRGFNPSDDDWQNMQSALLDAVHTFDTTNGQRPSLYFLAAMTTSFRGDNNFEKQQRPVHIPPWRAGADVIAIRNYIDAYNAKHCENPSLEQVACDTGFSLSKVRTLWAYAIQEPRNISIEAADADSFGLLQTSAPAPDNNIEMKEANSAITNALDMLSNTERAVVEGVFAINGDKKTHKTIANELNITTAAVRDIYQCAINKLRPLLSDLSISEDNIVNSNLAFVN